MGFFLFVMVFLSAIFMVVMLVAPLFIAIPVTLFQFLLCFFGVKSYIKGKKAGVYKPATLFFSGFHILFLVVYLLTLFMITIPYEEKSDTGDMIAGIDKFLSGKGIQLPAWLKHKSVAQPEKKTDEPATKEMQAPTIKMKIEDDPSPAPVEKAKEPEIKKESEKAIESEKDKSTEKENNI